MLCNFSFSRNNNFHIFLNLFRVFLVLLCKNFVLCRGQLWFLYGFVERNLIRMPKPLHASTFYNSFQLGLQKCYSVMGFVFELRLCLCKNGHRRTGEKKRLLCLLLCKLFTTGVYNRSKQGILPDLPSSNSLKLSLLLSPPSSPSPPPLFGLDKRESV